MEEVVDQIVTQKYPEYKDSGVPGLGEIPSHWMTLANKYIFKLKKNQVGKKSGDYVLLSLTLNGVIKRDMDNPQGKFPAEFNTYQEVKNGDFIFCLFDVEETPRTVGLSSFDGMITGAYTIMTPGEYFDKKFLYYFYLNLDVDKRMKPLYTGLRNIISKENFFSFKTFFPPKKEQTRIAQFLDRKTAQIDEVIAQKERQIDLFEERKQLIINNAITRGLNPKVRTKDSGVKWIGTVPEHWQVKPLRFIGKTQNGISKGAEYFGSGFPFVGYGDVYNHIQLPDSVSGLAKSTIDDRMQYSVLEGDVFFTRTSETVEEIGFSSTCRSTIENATFSGFLIRFRPNHKILSSNYSKYYFSSKTHRVFFVGEMNLVIRASLSQDLLKRLPVLLPPIEEQKLIADYLDRVSSKIERVILFKYQEIEKLKELKSTLINSTVTGKIKV